MSVGLELEHRRALALRRRPRRAAARRGRRPRRARPRRAGRRRPSARCARCSSARPAVVVGVAPDSVHVLAELWSSALSTWSSVDRLVLRRPGRRPASSCGSVDAVGGVGGRVVDGDVLAVGDDLGVAGVGLQLERGSGRRWSSHRRPLAPVSSGEAAPSGSEPAGSRLLVNVMRAVMPVDRRGVDGVETRLVERLGGRASGRRRSARPGRCRRRRRSSATTPTTISRRRVGDGPESFHRRFLHVGVCTCSTGDL